MSISLSTQDTNTSQTPLFFETHMKVHLVPKITERRGHVSALTTALQKPTCARLHVPPGCHDVKDFIKRCLA
jgi:hypothetical protein